MHKNYFRSILILISFSSLFFSCSINEVTKVWQPWTRTHRSYGKSIPLKSSIAISITGETKPMLGSEKLLQENMGKTLKDLFERRGYIISNDSAEFSSKFSYKTERHDIVNNTFESYNYLSNYSYAGTDKKTNLGVAIAGLLALASSSNENYIINNSQTIESYNHAISIEVYNKNDELIFKGESSWDSRTQDIEDDLKTAVQIILSSLPSDPGTYPRAAEVMESKKENYFVLKCKDNWFSCPALPYRITFPQNFYYIDKLIIKDGSAFEAYTDLILTAENALPKGSDNYSDPLNKRLWKKVQLCSKYYIGKSSIPKNILIDLEINRSGYEVSKCRVASDEEYTAFENNLKKWNAALAEYYHLYVSE